MKKILLGLSMILMLGLSAQGTMAQSLDDAEGVDTIYSRLYSTTNSSAAPAAAAPKAPNSASPSSASTNLEADAVERRSAEIIGMTFSSEDDAQAFVDDLHGSIEEASAEEAAEAEAEVKDLEQDAHGFFAVMNVKNTGVNAIIVMADGNQVFIIDVMVPEREESIELVNNLADFVLEHETESEDVFFSEDGTSTGGVFDRMPESDDELVSELGGARDEAVKAEDAD